MGPVFRAYDAARERLVAVKLFKLDVPPERVHQLVAEFERLIEADLTHPAIVRPVATGISGVAAYLAQEYVAAESLDLAVREYGPAPPADALRVAAQLAGALDFGAVVNIHHGALHPRDVLLSSDDTRLTGVGVAQALQKIGVAVPVRRPYSAPERLNNEVIDGRADVFSLAAVIYELLSGKRVPGAGEPALDTIVGADAAALGRVFARALADRPGDRYATALEFVEAMKQAFRQSSVTSHQSPVDGKTSPRSRPATDDRRLTAAEPLLPLDQPEVTDRVDLEIGSAPPAPGPTPDVPPAFDVAEVFTPDLPLAVAEQQRYEDVEIAPTIADAARPAKSSERALVDDARTAGSALVAGRDSDQTSGSALVVDDARPTGRTLVVSPPNQEPSTSSETPPVYESAFERTRSAIWPLLLALGVGVAVGFAGGYGVGSRDRTAPPASAVAAADPAPARAGKEFTDGEVKPDDSSGRRQTDAEQRAPEVRPKPDTAAEPRPAPSPEQTAAPGRLLVRSTPAGARVTVDGRDAGETPAVVRDLNRGVHSVRVSRDGYVPIERRVVITSARPALAITVPLARERAIAARGTTSTAPEPETPGTTGRFIGALSIESRPTGAKVFLDGRLIGTTPLAMPSVAAGEHAVRLERDGYRHWTSSVRVVASEQNRVTASLER